MASQKMKFEMNIEKLSFKFEGDFEQGQKIQTGISKAIGEIANLQNGAMGLPPIKAADARVLESNTSVSEVRKRRRKRKVADSPSEETLATNGGGEETTEAQSEGAGTRKPSGVSPKGLLMELRKDGFFEEGKIQGEVVAELAKRGYTKILPTSLPHAFTKLVQEKILSRDKNSDNVWVYSPGVNNG
jgi:hypothetical protein